MHKWWDNLTLGEKISIGYKYSSERPTEIIEKAYRDHLKNFKLKIV